MGKFDARSNEGAFIGYSNSSKAYRGFNKRTQCTTETVREIFDESGEVEKLKDQDELDFEELLQFHRDSVNVDQNSEGIFV